MTDPITILVALLMGLVVGAVLGVLLTRSRAAAAEARVAELRAAVRDRDERAERDGTVLRELAPVRHELGRMRATVDEIESERLQLHGRLSEQLREQAAAGLELRESTTQLAAAMRSSTARGGWGEAQLQNLLESAGLVEHIDVDYQYTVRGDNGTQRPDAVVHLPGGHTVVIDAKAPMARYLEAMSVPQPGDEHDRKRRRALLADHAQAVRGHIDALAKRDYPSVIDGSAQLTIAYLPSEAALSAALTADGSLLDHAFAKGVALSSPTSLWAILRAIAASWRQQRVDDSAAEVLALSTDLYRRLSTAATHLAKLGRSLKSSVDTYDQFVGSLESRVLPTARRLADLDPAARPIDAPELIDRVPRVVTAPELTPGTDDAREARV